MGKVLKNEELEQFIKDYKIDECFSIILKIDENNKKASYVIDGEFIVDVPYEEVISYFNEKDQD